MDEIPIAVLVITALKDELDALLALELDGEGTGAWTRLDDRNGLPYHVRAFKNEHGELLHVAAAWAGDMGANAATERAGALLDELAPGVLAMCGICAGRRTEVFLGDVIVASHVYSYDRGKHLAAREGHAEDFLHDIETYNLEAQWRMRAEYLASGFAQSWEGARQRPRSKDTQRRWLLQALHAHERDGSPSPREYSERSTQCPRWSELLRELQKAGLIEFSGEKLALTGEGRRHIAEERLLDDGEQSQDPPFQVHVGPMATGVAVKEDPRLFDRLKHSMRKVLGAEMEASAIGFLAERRGLRSLIVKAVSDYADHDKDNSYRQFACQASAAFLMAFFREYLRLAHLGAARERRPRGGRALELQGGAGSRDRNEFLTRVARACEVREPEGTSIVRREAPPPFGEFLEVSVFEGRLRLPRVFPVAAIDQPPTEELLDTFLRGIHGRYQQENPAVISTLVHVGQAAPEELARKAFGKHVRLMSFLEYQGLIDFTAYLRRQTARLEDDAIYPPALYVTQQAQVSIGGQAPGRVDDVLEVLLELLHEPGPSFALVLGAFGTGKTFLLHELARRMGREEGPLIPVLIQMRSLQKQRTLRELVAQHFAAEGMGRLEVDRFLYMLREGRIALLFDGFDELVLRATYDRVLEHFGTLLEAAGGDAKVVITSRQQHFLKDDTLKSELARRVEVLRGYRLVTLERFTERQIHCFLSHRLESASAAHRYLELLKNVQDLLGLAENPRLLGFIADLGVEKLEQARDGTGELTSAKLYALLIDQWLKVENARLNPPGAPGSLGLEQLWSTVRELALLLWARSERTVYLEELPEELLVAVNAWSEHALDTEVIKHQLGSGSLLERDEDGRFSFVHQSILEWLVAEVAAREVLARGDARILCEQGVTDLLAEFFIAHAGQEAALAWAEARLVSQGSHLAQRNALCILGRLHRAEARQGEANGSHSVKNLEGNDLRGQELSGADLRHANLRRTNLSGVTLVKADLMGAHLQESNLARADLEQARLGGADLTDAELSNARLLGADLCGAVLKGARLRAAKLIGARADSLEGADVFGAAISSQVGFEPVVESHSACCAMAFSGVDELLATGHEDGSVRLWDATTGNAVRILDVCAGGVRSVAFSPDGALLALASDDGTVRLWRIAERQSPQVLQGHSGSVRSVAFSPDGALLASASDDRTVRLWNLSGGRPPRVLQGHSGSVRSVAFSPRGALLASASDDRTVRLWSTAEWQLLHLFGDQPGAVSCVAFGPDGETLAAAAEDGTVRLWNAVRGQLLQVSREHSGAVFCVAFKQDGAILASASADKTVRIWRLAGGQLLHTLEGRLGGVTSIAFDPGGSTLAVATEGRVRLWSASQGQSLRVLSPGYSDLAFSPDGFTLVCAAAHDLHLCSTTQERVPSILRGHQSPILRVAFSPNNATVASASQDGKLCLWSVDRLEEPMRLFNAHEGAIVDLAFSSNGLLLASASVDGTVRLWSTDFLSLLLPLRPRRTSFAPEGGAEPVRCVTLSPDGALLATGSEDGIVRLWSPSGGNLLDELEAPAPVLSAAFSPDGVLLACAHTDKVVRLWSIAERKLLRILKGHMGAVRRLVFHPEQPLLASASDDGTVRLWDVATGAWQVTLLDRPDGWVSFRPDGRYKLGGSTAGAFWHTLGLCRFDPGELDPHLPTPLRIPESEPLLS